jgi:hypothetical protein
MNTIGIMAILVGLIAIIYLIDTIGLVLMDILHFKYKGIINQRNLKKYMHECINCNSTKVWKIESTDREERSFCPCCSKIAFVDGNGIVRSTPLHVTGKIQST